MECRCRVDMSNAACADTIEMEDTMANVLIKSSALLTSVMLMERISCNHSTNRILIYGPIRKTENGEWDTVPFT